MDMTELINRINILYKKKLETGLTEDEQDEQRVLRVKYLSNFRENFRAQLETVEKKENRNS